MNDAEKAGKAYETYMKANMVTGLPDLLTGGALSRGAGSAVSGALGRMGLGGGEKTMRDDAANWGNGIRETSQGNYNAYNDLLNLRNQGLASNKQVTGQSASGVKAVKKSTSKGHKTNYYNQYGIGNQSGDYAMDQYADYLLGGGNQGASDWLATQQNAYQNAMNDAYNSQVNDYTNAIQQMIGAGVTDRDTAAFDEAKSKLDAQKAYGYLSDTGYAKALDKLRGQTALNQDAMRQAGVGAQTKFLSDLGQQYGTIQNNPWDWAANQRDINRDQDWLNFTKWGQDNQLSQGYLNSLMDAANQYTPDEWIAYGAGAQGQYNPYQDFTTGTRKKRKDLNNENINEV